MKDMKKLEDLLWKELEDYKHRDKLTMSDLEIVHKITDTLKNIEKIEMLEGGCEHSHRTHGAEPRYGGRYYYDDDGGESYRRGRSYETGRSHGEGTEQMVGKLERMMEDAEPKHREMLQRLIGQMQNS